MSEESEALLLADAAAWRAWLDAHEDSSDGVWLVIAKKGAASPTSLGIAQALEEALCSGWIDGQRKGLDAVTFRQRFTPRRKASLWSQRNVGIVARLVEEGRMRPRGQAEIDRAKADGRWERAYAGQATAQVPEDLAAALADSPAADAHFATLNKTARFLAITPVVTAPNPEIRSNRIAKLIAKLERGEQI